MLRNIFRSKDLGDRQHLLTSSPQFFTARNSTASETVVPTASNLETLSREPNVSVQLRANPAAMLAIEHQWNYAHAEDPWNPETDTSVSSRALAYSPLSNADAQIRLLTLLPNESPNGNGGPIRCKLEPVSLFDANDYTALSYMWGNDGKTRVIVVDGHKFNATTNLYYALRMLRAKGITKIWIDAICINQQDNEEKTHQLQRMRSIYARAKQVVVWLGPESPNSNLAMYLLDKLSKPPGPASSDMSYHEALKERSISAPSGPFAEAWKAFDDLFEREYWQRVWVIQEIAASSQVLVCCGQESISWSDLETAFWGKKQLQDVFFKRIDADFSKHPRNTQQVFDFWAWKKAMASAQPQPLLKALIDSRRSKATNPRDHIYALLGISGDSSSLVPLPNYTHSVEKIYTDLATTMIRANGNLDIICLHGRTEAREYKIPSWVPNWSGLADIDRPWLFKSVLNNSGKAEDEIATVFNHVDDSYSIRVESGILCVSGRLFAPIDGLSTGMLDDTTPVGEILQPKIETSAYAGRQGLPDALHDALIMLLDIPKDERTSNRTDLVHYLTRPKGLEIMKTHGHDMLANWFQANVDMKICGIPLHTLTSKFGANDFQWKKRLTHRYEDKAGFTAKMHKYMTDIETVLKGGMRLMTTTGGHLGMAHPQARPGDHICLLEGMSNPVILRPCADGELSADAVANRKELERELEESRYLSGMTLKTGFTTSYKVVGEAFVSMDGMTKFMREYPYPFGTFFIH
ncbi:HET-domain-containing protein [Cucurbitaria berberidis CBS 394.84]|uniref:HET-domain-containing protein n=1 Tax=Cucurbitaria berberidis CBS 394.84 TaxID=1168544 RepID=A0A9P4GNP5_9PLEO|nr:HET-domain-containing protein [Cucurbitaria berberidis CBS 394.84]KAF1848611.1 HET-domain-containing protein [Cucurbitaria berberidis CBS 394.84]